jgi:ABC-type multidrug transport system fused ATPase/permease subunit
MKFSYSAVWADVTALLRSHFSLIATVAGVFIFLPGLLTGYFLPQPEATDPNRILQLWVEYASANWPWLILAALVGMVGAIAILLLVFARGISVGGAIAAAVALLPSYFIASFLSSLAIGFGIALLIVPGLYLIGRLGPLNAVVVAETHRNPIAAIRRCWALTAGHGWAIFGLIFIVALAAAIVVGVATTVIGIVLMLIAGQDIGQLLVLIVRTAGSTAMTALLLVLSAAIYRQLREGRSASAAPAAGAPPAH